MKCAFKPKIWGFYSFVVFLRIAFSVLEVGFCIGQMTASAQTQIPSSSGGSVTPSASSTPALRLYMVVEGDNLWDIADALYGNPWIWPEFLKFNSIPDPDLIFPGQKLLVPEAKVLNAIQDKTSQEVKEIRENLEKLGPPVPVTILFPNPGSQTATQSAPPEKAAVSPTPIKGTVSPSPTPQNTPTFKITGSKTINFSDSEAVGNSLNGTTNTGFNRHETLTLNMEGQLNDEVKISGHFAQSDLALQDEYNLTLSTKHWEFFFGDFPPTLPGSQFLSSNMTTTGLRITGRYDNFDITAFYGTPQGRPVYEKFFGNNTQGPYTIPDVPLVPSSEIVWVNKQKLTRGVDYNIDYTIGNLTFINRIIQLTDLIEIQAQSGASVYNTQVFGYHTDIALAGKLSPLSIPTPVRAVGIGPGGLTNIPGAIGAGTTNIGWPVTQTALIPSPTPSATPPTGTPTLSGGSIQNSGTTPTPTPFKGFQWTVGQGYLCQLEQPDPNATTSTAMVAANTHMLEVDTNLNWGPVFKMTGEADGSLYQSSDIALSPSKEGAAYRLQGESFQGPFHLLGKVLQASPNFTNIGNPLESGSYLDWTAQADYKAGDRLFGQVDRTFQRIFTTGVEDDTTTDHGEAKFKPKDFPELDYVYYQNDEERADNPGPFKQNDLRNTASVSTGLPGKLTIKASALQESQSGMDLGDNDSYGGRLELASAKWAAFNFSASGEWRLNNIVESASNTLVPTATPGNDIFSQTYTYTIEGKPVSHLTLTGKGMYSDAPPGPTKANLTQAYQTDPFPWLKSNGNYSLDFQQTQALGNETPDDVHTASGSLEATPLKWLKLTAQPSLRLDILAQYNHLVSQNYHQNYRSALMPSFVSLTTDYTLDQYWTWDSSTQGFPMNFEEQTGTLNLAAKKSMGKVQLEAGYKRVDQTQNNISSGPSTTTHTLTQTENDSIAWNANTVLTFTLSHAYNQLNQESPGQGNISNPLLPYGADTFNTTYPTNSLNGSTYSHTFTGRVAEQVTKSLSIYEEGGYTRTVDLTQGGKVDTYSPAAGFTWKASGFISWTTSYQYNGSSGEVSTTIQKAQTTLSATLSPGALLAANWNWTRADNPFIQSQQGTVSYTMNF